MSSFRLKGSTRRTTMMATMGVIRGGAYDGWRYVFDRFEVDSRGGIRVNVITGEPGWPFPKPLSLGRAAFGGLESVKGERAPSIDAAPLIAQVLAGELQGPRADRVRRVNARYLT